MKPVDADPPVRTWMLAVACVAGLAGCGGTAPSGGAATVIPPTVPSGLLIPPGGANTSATGTLSSARGAVDQNGKFVPTAITVNGTESPVLRAFSGDDVFSDQQNFYRVVTGSDGQSYAIAGFSPSGAPIGNFFSAASLPQSTGTATYTGTYRGQLFGAFSGPSDIITGNTTLQVSFGNPGQIQGAITDRNVNAPQAAFDLTVLEGDVAFAGTVINGIISATHADGNSNGPVEGVLFGTGAVGIVGVSHEGGSTLSATAIPEIGAFSAD